MTPASVQPPTGTVTFLFTDIEGSTRHWESSPDAMRPALARHDQLLREAIEGHGGFVFKTVGDAFCAAFATANQALDAALAAQAGLAAESWELPMPLLVRMALHTGTCDERGGDYFGQPLNRVARLMAAGHGGQTLLSDVTQGLVRDALPENAFLLDLEEHRLKDLGRPEQVFQLQHPSLPTDFPPLRSLNNPALPNNLPQQTTSFVGREKQVADVKELLGRTRLLTLTGAGGSGKTRLSLQVAADLLDGEGDGVWLVELAALTDPALVPGAVAQALGVKEQAGRLIQHTLVEALKPKRLLLVLDNCEHLVSACAFLAADLLRNCPHVHIMASSREALNVAGEQAYRVPSLTLPDPKKRQTVESLSQFEAVRLFIERGQAVQASFTVTDASAPAVAQVCWRLDGIPLAIELAAARVRSLSADEINTRLDSRFRLLRGGSRNVLPRQQTLRALIDWSYDLLTEPEKALLRRLSVFAGGWTLAGTEGICADEDTEAWEVLDLLTSLVDKSLVIYEEEERFRLLETVRQYAHDRLEEGREAAVVRGRAAAWFLALAEEAEIQTMGPEQVGRMSRLDAEHDNLRASLAWYEQSAQGGEPGLRLVGALWPFWDKREYWTEGRQWLGKALGHAAGLDGIDRKVHSTALHGAGVLALRQGEYTGARVLLGESLSLYRQLGDRHSMADLLNHLGTAACSQTDYGTAQAFFGESLALYRQLGNQRAIAHSLANLGITADYQGDYTSAHELYTESLTLRRQLGDQKGIADSLTNLGAMASDQGDYASARVYCEESLAIYRQLGEVYTIAIVLNNLGELACSQRDYDAAHGLYEESLTLRRQLGDRHGIAYSLVNLGAVALDRADYAAADPLLKESLTLFQSVGDPRGVAYALEEIARLGQGQSRSHRAAQTFGAADALRQASGSPLSPEEQKKIEQRTAAAREALGDDAFTSAWEAGQSMTLEQAVEYALAGE